MKVRKDEGGGMIGYEQRKKEQEKGEAALHCIGSALDLHDA